MRNATSKPPSASSLPQRGGAARAGVRATISVPGEDEIYAQIRGAVLRPIYRGNLPVDAITTDVQGYHWHGGVTDAQGSHAHSTDVQGLHSHGGQTGNNDSDHTHTGYTDGGNSAHSHSIALPAIGSGTAGGVGPVMSPAFGNAAYTTDVALSHTHNIQTYGESNVHVHYLNADGNHGHNISTAGNHQHNLNIYGDGSHQHTITLGSGIWFDIMAPVVVVTKIIYAGSEASTRATRSGVATTASRRLAAPARGRH